ncbi:hypothetical protein [Natrialba aegyptia]|uniref:Uncharacterized protein n=1 Tax=Natrialba aegyptia DSM 13077 TaxID=1227491 RepID=M0BDW3_9EURY|nr:hypothetical protein [Natrialba aegyptia]ELZ07849.1 hypothetical protein C480_03309 [Natrialba aegyptia DSM 13077]
MSATAGVEVPDQIRTLTERYTRTERFLTLLVAAVAVIAVFGAFVVLPYFAALGLSLAAIALVRVPLLETEGELHLRTDADPDAVRNEFASALPPALPFQWGGAETVRSTADGGVYEFSYLFGRRSITMAVTVRSGPETRSAGADCEIDVTAGGKPWGRYRVSVEEDGENTAVVVAFESTRRYALNRLTQLVAANRYQEEAYAAQGYTVVDRDRSLTLGRD